MALTLHITGFTMLVGATLSSYVSMRRLWKATPDNREGAGRFLQTVTGLSRVAIIGGLMVIIAGATMITLIVRAGPVEPQRWFQIKIILVLLLILNIVFIGGRQARHLKAMLNGSGLHRSSGKLDKIRRLLRFFYAAQLLLMFTIFVLSAFRFN